MAFNKWIIIDWAGVDASKWEIGDERWTNFLFKTEHGHKWLEDGVSLSELSEKEFILILLLDENFEDKDLVELGVAIDSILQSHNESVPTWCHYGGYFRRDDLLRKWERFPLLNESLRSLIEKRLPSSLRYPLPFSWSGDMNQPWQHQWELFANDFRSGSSWNILLSGLNKAWEIAIEDIKKIDFQKKMECLLKQRSESEQLSNLIINSSNNLKMPIILNRAKVFLEELSLEIVGFELGIMIDIVETNQVLLDLRNDANQEECMAKIVKILLNFNKGYDSLFESNKNLKIDL